MIEKYQPSNATEGDIFMSEFCANCIHDDFDIEGNGKACQILNRTMAYSIKDPEYPIEWQYDENDQPVCTAFEDEEAHYRCTRTLDMFAEGV